jgi:hypothetical protein
VEDEFELTINTDGTILFTAYCLRTDSWHDYRAFLAEAEASLTEDNTRKANRLLRAALVCFFSHLEGVVNHIESRVSIPAVQQGNRLCDRTRNIGQEARKRGRVPHVEFRLGKHLRDLVAHPGIGIDFSDRESSTVLGQEDVFERLSVQTLRGLEGKVVPWLDAVCAALKVERFTDTEARCRKIAELLNSIGPTETREV